jgi:hypothetical protein
MQAELPEAAFPEVEAVPDKSNGLVESWVTPVDCEDDDFDEVSDLRASNTDDAAPRASSMTELLQMPHGAAFCFHANASANAVPPRKPNKMRVFRNPNGTPSPAIDAVAADFSAHRRAPDAAQRHQRVHARLRRAMPCGVVRC